MQAILHSRLRVSDVSDGQLASKLEAVQSAWILEAVQMTQVSQARSLPDFLGRGDEGQYH